VSATATAGPPAVPPPPPKPLELPDASALVAPPRDDAAAVERAEQPSALKPQAAQPARPPTQKRPPTRRLEPGDLICPDCGEGNPATRKFCSRCGASLETAVTVKPKWWHRFKPGRGPKKRKAGDRPSARKTRKSLGQRVMGFAFGGVARVVGALIIVGGIVIGMVPSLRNAFTGEFHSIYNKINSWIHPTRTEVQPTDVFVSGRPVPGHGNEALKDTATNTFFLERVPRPGSNLHITVTYHFGSKFDLKNLAVWNGIGDSKVRDYNSTQRPRTVFMTFPDNPSIAGCSITFGDTPGEANKLDVRKCNANGIDEVAFRFDDFYTSSHAKFVALAKIQFYKG
jgi:zinc-ribbon domain